MGIALLLMVLLYFNHPFRHFYKTPWEMFGLTKQNQEDESVMADVDSSNWKTFENTNLGIGIKYPSSFIFTKKPDRDSTLPEDEYSSYVFSNKEVLKIEPGEGKFEDAALQSKGLSTLTIEKAFIDRGDNTRYYAVVPEEAKNDLEKFAKAWSKVTNYSLETINGVKMLRTKPEGCNLLGENVVGRGKCSSVYLKSKDNNYFKIDIFVNAYDKTSASIFNEMVTTIVLP